MTNGSGLVLPASGALGAACAFGVAAALQHRQAACAPASRTPSLRLLAAVSRRPLWLAGLALAAVAYALSPPSSDRREIPAAAAGVIFGLTAAVTASFVRSLRLEGLSAILGHWQLWALMTLGILGLLLSTSAFQASALSASLPVIDTVEPVSGVVIGAVLFNERLASSPAGLMAQLGAAAVAVTGIAMLGPQLAAAGDQGHRLHSGRPQCDLLKASNEATTGATTRAATAARATAPRAMATGAATTEGRADQRETRPCR